ncbi:MAG: 2-oxoacid:acceptor oxidoreductase family protein [Opitutaceae bacterium]
MNAAAKSTVNVRFAGLGGTGVIRASDILADVAFRSGRWVRKAEVHGMSQRGGSVQSDVRIGEGAQSPMIPNGSCDFLVVLEPSEVETVLGGLRPDGVLLTPADIPAEQLRSAKALNVALLGRLSRHFDFPEAAWSESLRSHFPARLHAANNAAFDLGKHP